MSDHNNPALDQRSDENAVVKFGEAHTLASLDRIRALAERGKKALPGITAHHLERVEQIALAAIAKMEGRQ